MMVAPVVNEKSMSTEKLVSESLLNVDFHSVKKASLVLRALNHKLRQQLLKVIEDEKKITVRDFYPRPASGCLFRHSGGKKAGGCTGPEGGADLGSAAGGGGGDGQG